MKILRSWLQDYIKTTGSDQELADLLTFSGSLVDSIDTGLDNKIIVAKIVEVNPHPNADKLRLAKVDNGSEIIDIVCGAPNIEVGQLVSLATLGTKFGDFEIKEAVIRGEKSYGMLCSEKELGLGDDHSGIKILPDNCKIGDPLNKYFGGDAVFDLEITPNRGDCLSHIGIAREYAALTKQNLGIEKKSISSKTNEIQIEILNNEHCQRYFGIVIKGIKIGPSPKWLKERLEKIGQNSINNVVDITNYIMFDLGQPLHAFDLNKVKDNKIIVRDAQSNETITTIDGISRNLTSDVLVIADSKDPIAIAGVMGGFDSEIDEKTTDIILEAAEFDRKSVRKTSKDLGLTTEASYRFERGVDPSLVEIAADKAAMMITDLCGGKIIGKVKDIANDYENNLITIPYQKVNDLLGTKLSDTQMNTILSDLGFKFKDDMCQAPTWRHDVALWQDLAEEIARIYGFAKIKLEPVKKTAPPIKSDYYFKEYVKDLLVNDGFVESYNYSFQSEKDIIAAKIDPSDLLELANPIQSENKYLRKSLVPGLLKNIAKNPIFDPVLVFEIGNVFTKTSESTNLGFAASGKQSRKIIQNMINVFANKLSVPVKIFNIIESSREEMQRFKIKKPVTFTVEVAIYTLIKNSKIDRSTLSLSLPEKNIHYRPISRFPSVPRDIAFIVDKQIEAAEIIEMIYNQSDLINRAELFDEFVSDKFGVGKKNIAFHIDLQHQEKTLTDKEADEILDKIIKQSQEFGATLRNY